MGILNYHFILNILFVLLSLYSCNTQKVDSDKQDNVSVAIKYCDDRKSIGIYVRNSSKRRSYYLPNTLLAINGLKIYLNIKDEDAGINTYGNITEELIDEHNVNFDVIMRTKCFEKTISKSFDEKLIDSISGVLSKSYFNNFDIGYKYFNFYLGTSILLEPGEEYHSFIVLPYLYRNERMYIYFVYPCSYIGTLKYLNYEKYLKERQYNITFPKEINGYYYYDRVILSNTLYINY